jgi:hypothetical protein
LPSEPSERGFAWRRSLFACLWAKSVFESGLRAHVRTDLWPAQLVRLERTVEWSGLSAMDAHTRLRPVLVEIAEVRLAPSWRRSLPHSSSSSQSRWPGRRR